jgi:hypothetical protein
MPQTTYPPCPFSINDEVIKLDNLGDSLCSKVGDVGKVVEIIDGFDLPYQSHLLRVAWEKGNTSKVCSYRLMKKGDPDSLPEKHYERFSAMHKDFIQKTAELRRQMRQFGYVWDKTTKSFKKG